MRCFCYNFSLTSGYFNSTKLGWAQDLEELKLDQTSFSFYDNDPHSVDIRSVLCLILRVAQILLRLMPIIMTGWITEKQRVMVLLYMVKKIYFFAFYQRMA